jgi:hypothetical protein
MKKIILICIIAAISNCFNLIAQIGSEEKSWAPIGATWFYSQADETGNPLHSYEKYVSLRDTLIEEKNCKVIKSHSNTEIMFSQNQKVYYWFNNQFHKIYDFDVNEGDTVEFSIKSFKPQSYIIDTTYIVNFIVEKVEVVNVDQINLKRVYTRFIKREELDHLAWNQNYIYTEHIGYEYDFLYLLDIPSIDFVPYLRCYTYQDIHYKTGWWETQNKECDFTLSVLIREQKYHDINFTIFPNPSSGIFTVKISKQFFISEFYVYVYDSRGELVYSAIIHSNQQEIDLSFLPIGIYHVLASEDIKPIKIIRI